MAAEFTIGEVARRAGVRASAIRFYEAEGVLPPPRRVSGRRRYDDDVFRQLGVIRGAQEAGFSLSEIRTLMGGFQGAAAPPAQWRELARRKLVDQGEQIARLEAMRRLLETGLACACLDLDDCPMM